MTLGNRSLLPPALRWRNWGSEIQRLARGHAVSKWWFWDAKTYHISTPQSCLSWQLSMPFTLVHGSGNRDPGRGIDVPKMSQRASERAEIRTLALHSLCSVLDNMENRDVCESPSNGSWAFCPWGITLPGSGPQSQKWRRGMVTLQCQPFMVGGGAWMTYMGCSRSHPSVRSSSPLSSSGATVHLAKDTAQFYE